MSVLRRDVLRALAAAGAISLAPQPLLGRGLARAPAGRGRRPRKFVQFYLQGGFDPLYSVDPKEKREVNTGIGPVYRPKQLIEAGGSRVGPLFAGLGPHLERLTIINGILSSTVAHEVGAIQAQQLRRNVITAADRSAVTLIGQALAPDAPLHGIHLGHPPFITWSPPGGRCFVDQSGAPLLGQLAQMMNAGGGGGDEMLRQVTALAGQARTHDAATSVKAILEGLRGKGLPEHASLKVTPWPAELRERTPEQTDLFFASQYEWAAFVLKHDLAPSVHVEVQGNWDGHLMNDSWQKACGSRFVAGLRWFLDQLATTRNTDGTRLIDDVGILVSSELGRFPYPNAQAGKDHFPLISAILIGPGLRPGQFGQTDKEAVGLGVNLATGRPKDASDTLMTLDDLGRTVLEWVGHTTPEDAGYTGRVLEFCFA